MDSNPLPTSETLMNTTILKTRLSDTFRKISEKKTLQTLSDY